MHVCLLRTLLQQLLLLACLTLLLQKLLLL
jgi:hypothetical protein